MKPITHPKDSNHTGIKFTIETSSDKTVFTCFGNDDRGKIKAVQIFLTMMGDKAKMKTPYTDFEIN